MKGLPLIARAPGGSILGWEEQKPISTDQFLKDAYRLSQRLPKNTWVINLCQNRYRFLVGFSAALMQGQTNILPPNRTPQGLKTIASQFPGIYCLTDDCNDKDFGLPVLEYPFQMGSLPDTPAVPKIPASHTAAIVFTSGSTGVPQPHLKSWESMVAIARNTGPRLIPLSTQKTAIIATVHPQHMYGLETSIMLPLQYQGALLGTCPFFPEDIRAALEGVPKNRILITTPIHLKACVESSVEFPEIALIVSATAPLSGELAAKAEKAFNTKVIEIYGCTEAGSLATRRTISNTPWELLDEIAMRGNRDQCYVEAAYLPDPVRLPDIIKNCENGRFELQGRSEDLVIVGGKRISLSELNFRLNEIKGVADGAYFMPPQIGPAHKRLVAFVVGKNLREEDILQALRLHLDPVFLPRLLFFVDRLPRMPSGKLSREALLEIFYQFSN